MAIFNKYFLRIPDWRQITEPTDYVIVAPKIIDLKNDVKGYTCPSGPTTKEFLIRNTLSESGGPEEDFKILSDGILMVSIHIIMSLDVSCVLD